MGPGVVTPTRRRSTGRILHPESPGINTQRHSPGMWVKLLESERARQMGLLLSSFCFLQRPTATFVHVTRSERGWWWCRWQGWGEKLRWWIYVLMPREHLFGLWMAFPQRILIGHQRPFSFTPLGRPSFQKVKPDTLAPFFPFFYSHRFEHTTKERTEKKKRREKGFLDFHLSLSRWISFVRAI